MVYIGDINDQAPSFDQSVYQVSLSEGTPIGTSIMTVTAQDPDINSTVIYSMEEGAFHIEVLTGVVTVAQLLDISLKAEHRFTLQASDGSHQTSALLIITLIDVNDHDPVFYNPVYRFRVPENDLTGQLGMSVGIVSALDEDMEQNGQVTYYITSSLSQQLFTIPDPDIGNITVAGILDRETEDKYMVIVTARDKGSPARMVSTH